MKQKREYPYNLLYDIFNPDKDQDVDILPYTTTSNLRMLLILLNELPPMRQKVIEMRYDRGLKFAEIGNELGLSRQRVHKIHKTAMKSLRSKESIKKIMMGYTAYMEQTKKASKVGVCDLGLKNGVVWNLMRAGYFSVADIKNASYSDLLKISRVGKTKANQILEAVEKYEREVLKNAQNHG